MSFVYGCSCAVNNSNARACAYLDPASYTGIFRSVVGWFFYACVKFEKFLAVLYRTNVMQRMQKFKIGGQKLKKLRAIVRMCGTGQISNFDCQPTWNFL